MRTEIGNREHTLGEDRLFHMFHRRHTDNSSGFCNNSNKNSIEISGGRPPSEGVSPRGGGYGSNASTPHSTSTNNNANNSSSAGSQAQANAGYSNLGPQSAGECYPHVSSWNWNISRRDGVREARLRLRKDSELRQCLNVNSSDSGTPTPGYGSPTPTMNGNTSGGSVTPTGSSSQQIFNGKSISTLEEIVPISGFVLSRFSAPTAADAVLWLVGVAVGWYCGRSAETRAQLLLRLVPTLVDSDTGWLWIPSANPSFPQ